nr:DNA cytosine methyltransferase [uncultured Oscillibacter sp.]
MLTMGSLFDGIGGFPLAAVRAGIEPLWASEIEAFPIEVTKRFRILFQLVSAPFSCIRWSSLHL